MSELTRLLRLALDQEQPSKEVATRLVEILSRYAEAKPPVETIGGVELGRILTTDGLIMTDYQFTPADPFSPWEGNSKHEITLTTMNSRQVGTPAGDLARMIDERLIVIFRVLMEHGGFMSRAVVIPNEG